MSDVEPDAAVPSEPNRLGHTLEFSLRGRVPEVEEERPVVPGGDPGVFERFVVSGGLVFETVGALGCGPDPEPLTGPAAPAGPPLMTLPPSSPALSSSYPGNPATDFAVVRTGLKDALGINEAGLVVGEAFSGAGPAIWTLAAGDSLVGPLPGGGGGRFYDVNANGEAVGVTDFAGYAQVIHWTRSTNTKVNLGIPATGPYGHAIADNGDVFGTAFEGYARTFFKPNGGAPVFLLATPPFVAVHSTDMNNSGVLVGAGLVTDFISHAISWPRYDQPLFALGNLGGDRSRAESINDAGDIVGWSELTPGNPTRHAILWPATGGMIDLTT